MTRTERRAEERRNNKAKRKQQRLGALSTGRTWIAAGALAAYTLVPGRLALAAVTTDPGAGGGQVATLPLKQFDMKI